MRIGLWFNIKFVIFQGKIIPIGNTQSCAGAFFNFRFLVIILQIALFHQRFQICICRGEVVFSVLSKYTCQMLYNKKKIERKEEKGTDISSMWFLLHLCEIILENWKFWFVTFPVYAFINCAFNKYKPQVKYVSPDV